MDKKLEYLKSVEIVKSVIRERRKKYTSISDASLLGDLLPEAQERHLFQVEVHSQVGSRGLHILMHEIPIEPHLTIRDVATTVSELAGDVTVVDAEIDAEQPGDPTVTDE